MAADKDKDLSGASEPDETSTPPELQHDDSHGFEVIRTTNVAGTSGPSDMAQSPRVSAAAAIEWIKSEVGRL